MADLVLTLDLWVGVEFWIPAGFLILLSLLVVGAPTSQIRGFALGAIFVLIAILACIAQQWLIALVATSYTWFLLRQTQRKPTAPVHLIQPSLPRPWRALALAGTAIFVGIWLLGVKRTVVWRFVESSTGASFSDLGTSLHSHWLTLLILGTAILVSIRSSRQDVAPISLRSDEGTN